MNDGEMLAAVRATLTGVRESLADVHLNRSEDAIRLRARRRRLRRGLSGAGAAGIALGAGLALALGSGGAAAPAGTRPVHVNLAAWSVNTTPAGVVDVTIRELDNPKLLGRTLADAGVRALISYGAICFPRHDSVPPSVSLAAIMVQPAGSASSVFGIRPAAIPAGDVVDIGYQKGVQAVVGVITQGSTLSCMIVPDYHGPPPPPPVKPAPYPASHYIVYWPPPAR